MIIKLKTIENVKEFACICSKYQDCNIDVRQGRYVVDGKSILGLFSLNLVEPVNVEVDAESEDVKKVFYREIKKWEAVGGL